MFTILVAVDGSLRAAGVLRAGARIARAMQARIVLYRAVYIPPEFPPAAATTEVDTLPAHLEGQARTQLAELAKEAADVPCELLVEHAIQPWRAILEASAKLEVDLTVLGSHGYHGWDRVLGTTAGKVANLADRDVLIVHEREPETSPPR